MPSLQGIVLLLERQGALKAANSKKGKAAADDSQPDNVAVNVSDAGSSTSLQPFHLRSSDNTNDNVGALTLAGRPVSDGAATSFLGSLEAEHPPVHPPVYPSYEKLGVELPNRARTLSLDNASTVSNSSSGNSSVTEVDAKSALHDGVMAIFGELEHEYPHLESAIAAAKSKFLDGLEEKEARHLASTPEKLVIKYMARGCTRKVRELNQQVENSQRYITAKKALLNAQIL